MHPSIRIAAVLSCGATWSWAFGAAQSLPLDPAPASAPATNLQTLRYVVAHDRIDDFVGLASTTLDGVLLPDGRLVDLELSAIDVSRMGFRFRVDGTPRNDLLDGLDLSIWKGHVRGLAGSDVMLSMSHVGVSGWIHTGSDVVHVISEPTASGGWWNAEVLFVAESELNDNGMTLRNVCETERPAREAVDGVTTNGGGGSSGNPLFLGPGCTLRECKISLETDFQYYQRFNDLNAQTVYTTTLWAFISDRYETQANTVLTFPYVGFYTNSNDPWTTPDAPGSSGNMLDEFRNAWSGNIPGGGRLGHFMSGASLGGGVAYLDVLCDNSFNFGVSGNINASTPFPITQNPSNWDFMVCAHEVGHNFDALHTHDYCPPLDECPPSQYFGQCQTQQVCTNQGTIMSYCHLCSGGTGNITTFFHPTSAQFMTAAAANCLPLYSGMSGTTLTLVAPNTPTAVSASIGGTPVGPVELLWRPTPSQSFAAIVMAPTGNGNYSAILPGFGCAESPQYYFAFTEQSCGLITFPVGAPAAAIGVEVGSAASVFADDFQSDLGWTTANLGASAGLWARGVPVNDPGWAYDPASDGDGSGSCWLTGNTFGNTDVDGGSVQLTSPQLDLSGPNVRVDYLYFLRLTVANGADALVVQISANGTSGPWVEIARHDDDQGLAWASHTILGSTITNAGVTLGSNMRMRFTANDGGTQSIVEAGLDGFVVSSVSCSGIGVSFCGSNPNSTGSAAVISAVGSNSIAANDLVLSAAPVPSAANGLFFFGANPTQNPFGNGVRCVASPVVRLGLGTAVGNVLTRAIDNTAAPASTYFAVGSTWNFQAWFRDPSAGGSNDNLSDGYRITYQP